MKKMLIALAVVSIIAVALSFGAARWFTARQPHHERPTTVTDAAWLTRELDLSASQAHAVRECEREFAAKIKALCERHCEARFALGAELAKANSDGERLTTLVNSMCRIHEEAERATMEHILKVKSLLTPAQAREYAARINAEVCTACPLGLHGGSA